MKKIRRRCKCSCGRITNYGKKWLRGHFPNMKDKKLSKEHKLKMSLVNIGNTNTKGNKGRNGKELSEEHKKRLALANIKYNPNYEYCDIWKDKEYKKDLRKDYCENIDCKNNYRRLCNHHIHLDKKKCAPYEIMTMCNPCHSYLHIQLSKRNKNHKPTAFSTDYIIISRPDHISYIHKKSREVIKIKRRTQN